MKKTQIGLVAVIVMGVALGLLLMLSSKSTRESVAPPEENPIIVDANSPKARAQQLLAQRKEKRQEELEAYEQMTPEEQKSLVQERVEKRLGISDAPSEAERQARIQAFKEKLAAMTPAQRQALLYQLRQEQIKRSGVQDTNASVHPQATTEPVSDK